MASSVITTLHNDDAHRCVKIVKRCDGTFGFSEFRRDPEDAGGWTLVSDNPRMHATEQQAVAAAHAGVGWLRDMAPPKPLHPKSGVVVSLHNDEVDRCVDIIAHPDGTFGFKEFRRDPEDRGGWTLVGFNPRAIFATKNEAIATARASVAWLRDQHSSHPPLDGEGGLARPSRAEPGGVNPQGSPLLDTPTPNPSPRRVEDTPSA